MKTETTKKCLFCQSEFSSTKDSLLCDPCQEHANNTVKGITSLVENFASIFEAEAKKVMNNFEKTKRVNDFWTLAHAAIWPNQNFSEDEITEIKEKIAGYFNGELSHNQTFAKLVVCAIRAGYCWENHFELEKPNPSIWFGTGNQSTSLEYSLIRLYKNSDKNMVVRNATLISEQILSYSQTNDITDLFNFRNTLIHFELYDYLPIYYQAVYHFQTNTNTYPF